MMPLNPTQKAEAAEAGILDGFGLIFTTTRPVLENRTNVHFIEIPEFFKTSP